MRRLSRFLPAKVLAGAISTWSIPVALLALSACTASIADAPGGASGGAASTGSSGQGGNAVSSSGASNTPQGGSGLPVAGGAGAPSVAAGGSGNVGSSGAPSVQGGSGPAAGAGSTAGGAGGTTTVVTPQCPTPTAVNAGRAPLRRLTPFEYNNTVRDLLGDTTFPADALPSDVIGNGFGNDAAVLSVSDLLAEQLEKVAFGIATRATQNATALGKLASCASNVTTANEETCARTIIEGFTPRAYRRALVAGEVDELLALYKTIRTNSTFATGVAAVIEAILQSPDFLYRLEWGTVDPARPGVRVLTGDEAATRLSYMLWGTTPDAALQNAAKMGELSTKAGVRTHAERMLADPRARAVVRFFYDSLLPVNLNLERDAVRYPAFSATVQALMREETQRFLEYETFENPAGTWVSALTAPYTFLNQQLATFYGMTGVSGDAFQKVPVDTTKRLGVLTHASVMAGTTTTNHTNPVLRGSFVVHKLMCRKIPDPPPEIAAVITPPDPNLAATARMRFSQHSSNAACAACHQFMDPLGLALENYDAIGQYRTTENGEPIDATGSVPGLVGATNGPIELVQKLATSEEVHNCFASHWTEFAYGLTLGATDVCTKEAIHTAFKSSGYNMKQLLLALTQLDAFHHIPAP